jgi:hypothetical protein
LEAELLQMTRTTVDPEHWRFHAQEARTAADQMTHQVARTIMRRIAIDYDRLAKLAEAREPVRGMAKKYPVLYTILVWIGIAAFSFIMFCGIYILSFLSEIPAGDGEVRQMLIENGAAIVALGATSLIYLGMSLWRNRAATK